MCVCVHVCVCVCVCVKRQSSTTAGFSLGWCSACSYCQQTTMKMNYQQGLGSKLTPRQAPAYNSISQQAVSWLWQPPRAAVSAWLTDQSPTRWFSQVKNNSDQKWLSRVWLFANPCSPWNSPGQDTGVGSLSLLQGIFPTQVSCIAGRFFTSWVTKEVQNNSNYQERGMSKLTVHCSIRIIKRNPKGRAKEVGKSVKVEKTEWPLLEWQGNEKYLEAQAKLAKTCAGKNFLWKHHFVIIIKVWLAGKKACFAYEKTKRKLALQNEWLLLQFLQGQWII